MSFGWALTQAGWGPHKKRRSGHRQAQEGQPREDTGRMLVYQPGREAQEAAACPRHDLGLWEDKCLLLKPPSPICGICYTARADRCISQRTSQCPCPPSAPGVGT